MVSKEGFIILLILACGAVYGIALIMLMASAERRGASFLKALRRYLVGALATLIVTFLGTMTLSWAADPVAAMYIAGVSILLLFIHIAIAGAFSRIEYRTSRVRGPAEGSADKDALVDP